MGCERIGAHKADGELGAHIEEAGTTYIACAFAEQACRKGYRGLYRRAARLFSELTLGRTDGTYSPVLAKIGRADVLVVDDFAMTPDY